MFSLIHLYFHGTVIFIPLDETESRSATEKLTEKLTAILPAILPAMNPCGIRAESHRTAWERLR